MLQIRSEFWGTSTAKPSYLQVSEEPETKRFGEEQNNAPSHMGDLAGLVSVLCELYESQRDKHAMFSLTSVKLIYSINIEWLSYPLVWSYEYCFTESQHVNDNTPFTPHVATIVMNPSLRDINICFTEK